MKATFRLSDDLTPIDPVTGKPMTVERIAKELDMNPRSITTLRKGTERGDWGTLVKLSRWLSEKHGRTISIEEMLTVEE
jgi:hypothetical protein